MEQAVRFDDVVRVVLERNTFYRRKLAAAGFGPKSPPTLARLAEVPWTEKSELVADQESSPLFGTNLSYELDAYTRLHQTSGTTGHPLRWLDTPDSWAWWLRCWQEVYRAAGVTRADRVFVAFSFGPFIGFWTAFEAGQQLGALMISGGGMSTVQRLKALLDQQATVLVCTPTYALHLAQTARVQGLDLAGSAIRATIHAGEPGASVPNVKATLEREWGARCYDHVGSTEMGAWGYSCGVANHLHVNEDEFIPEVIDPDAASPARPDAGGVLTGELVLTNLGRLGSPLIRYRTGDLVRLDRLACPCGRTGAVLYGGVLGRRDDMVVVRGVNVFPAAVENCVRHFQPIGEFEVVVRRGRGMAELEIRIEVDGADGAGTARALASHVHDTLHLRPSVDVVPAGTLPRYELKARRFRIVEVS